MIAWRFSVAAAALTVGLAGCSSNSTPQASGAAPTPVAGAVNDQGTKDLTGAAAPITVDMTAADNSFAPTFLKTSAGATVKVSIRNVGARNHSFTVDDQHIDQTLQPGQQAQVTVAMPASGALTFYCRFHRSSGMQGAFLTTGSSSTPPTPPPAAGAGGY